jgi:hypothetical protein
MSHKPQPGKQNPHPQPKQHGSQEKSTNRHVYIEPGAQIDFVQDLRQKHDAAQEQSATHNKKVLFWTITSAILLFIYAGITGLQACLTRQSLRSTETFATLEMRPYLYLAPEGNIPGLTTGTTQIPNRGIGFFAMIHTKNFGKSPARHVFNVGEILIGDNLTKVDEWFTQIGVPLHMTVDSQTGWHMMPNGIGIEEKSAIMQEAYWDVTAYQLKELKTNELPTPPAMLVDRIEYNDSVGTLYWTDICYKLGSDPNGKIVASPCTTHNEIH